MCVCDRFMGEYTDYPADYAEVSSFQSGQQSPAPYATTTLIGSSKLAPNDAHRFNNMFIYPKNGNAPMMHSSNSNSNNYNRSIHSESYCSGNNNNNGGSGGGRVNIVENRMASTMMPNMFNQHHQASNHNGIKIGSNKRNRLKLMKPQNIRNYFSSPGEQLYVKVGEINQMGPHSSSSQQSHTPQSQSGSINWSQHNFNLYENQLHNHLNNGATVNHEPDDANDDDEREAEEGGEKGDFIYTGNRSIMSYTSSKDFPENV
jgi:roundabout axon guidance receptor 2